MDKKQEAKTLLLKENIKFKDEEPQSKQQSAKECFIWFRLIGLTFSVLSERNLLMLSMGI